MKVFVVIGEYEEFVQEGNTYNKVVNVEGIFVSPKSAIKRVNDIVSSRYMDRVPVYERYGDVCFMGDNGEQDKIYMVLKEIEDFA